MVIFLGKVHGCGQPCPETPTSFLGVRTLRVLVISNIAFLIEEKSFENLHSTPIFGVYSPLPPPRTQFNVCHFWTNS